MKKRRQKIITATLIIIIHNGVTTAQQISHRTNNTKFFFENHHIESLTTFFDLYNKLEEYSSPKSSIRTTPCQISKVEQRIIMSLSCIHNLSDHIIEKDFTEIIESQRENIEGFNQKYNTEKANFNYKANNSIIRKTSKQQAEKKQRKKIKGQNPIPYPLSQRTVNLSKDERERFLMLHYSYYTTQRDLRKYPACSKNNFYVAAISVDKKYVEPEEEFNVNKRIAHRIGYCKDIDEDVPFYGGVCGVASLVFRIALIHPAIGVLERSAHSDWLSEFYGQNVRGDDAAVAQYYKQLRLVNNSPYPLYFKFHETIPEEEIHITAITPTSSYHDYITTIKKEQTGQQSAKVTQTIVEHNKTVKEEVFTSEYKRIQ